MRQLRDVPRAQRKKHSRGVLANSPLLIREICSPRSSHCPAPFSEGIHPEIAVVHDPDQMPSQVQLMTDSRMSAEKPLRLLHGLESSHPSLPFPGRLVPIKRGRL